MPTSMILRFRDLAGPIGSTIASHKQIAETRGSVWWAWWNKPYEKIPRDLFAQFKQVINDNRFLEAYLADSGRYLLYRARITEIQEANTEEPIESPSPEQTPQYYRTTPYKAWFRLTQIEQVPTDKVLEELHKWSYDEIASFTDDPFISSYQDKRIFHLEEVLHRRHRTIYFVQPYKAEHKTHLVETLPKVQPQNFIKEPIVGQSSFILHLSDLHFGPEHEFATTEDEAGKRTLARWIIDDLRNEATLGAPAAVIISGDLTWQAKEEEFEIARKFIDRLKSEFALESYHFVVVPGNHDIKWVDDPAKKPIGGEAQKVKFPEEEAKQNFREFYVKLFGIPPDKFFSQGRRFLLANYVTVDVIGLSSSELEQTHFAGYGYVKAEQLQAAMKEMGWEEGKPRASYRLVTLHHHLMPVVPEEEIKGYDKNYSITLDAGHIIYECLARGVDMVVHGHQHQPFTGAIMRSQGGKKFKADSTLVVNATGSAGVKKEHIPSGKNVYTVYEFDPSGHRIRIRLRMKSDIRVGFDEDEGWRSELERNPSGGMLLKSGS